MRLRAKRENNPTPIDPLAPAAPEVEKALSNVDLADEMPGLISTTVGYKVNLNVIGARDEMIGNLLDITA